MGAAETTDAKSLAQKMVRDGVYIYASPLRLHRDDLPMILGVSALLGGAFALDTTTRRNLIGYSDGKAATDLRHYGDIAQFSGPIVGSLFLLHGWTKDNVESKKTGWLAFESFLWSGAVELTMKFAIGRRRPSGTDDPFSFQPGQSDGAFPSGHTTTAFAAATVFAEQYPTWKVVIPAYAAAGAVGFSRIYSNQHWGSDVVGGALLGIGVSHLLRKIYDRPDSDWRILSDGRGLQLANRF